MERERLQKNDSQTKVIPYEESDSDDEVKVVNFEQDDEEIQEKTLDSFISKRNETKKICIFEDYSKVCVAVDTSGSTSGKILDISKKIIHTIFDNTEKCDELLKECISWESKSIIMPLDTMRASGGTSPETILDSLKLHQSILVVTTDGEISDSSTKNLAIRVSKSHIVHVIAIYIGDRDNSPKDLKLPVFAPFIDIPGIFILFHWDGNELSLLLKKRLYQEFPDPPSQITADTKWTDFPVINPKDILNFSSNINSKVALSSGEVFLSDSSILNINQVLDEANKYPNFVSSTTFDSFVRNQLSLIIYDIRNYHELPKLDKTFREIANIWKHKALPKAETEALKQSNVISFSDLQKQATTLLQRKNVLANISGENLTEEIKREKENVYVQYQQTLQKLYTIKEDNSKIINEFRLEIEHIYAEIMSALKNPMEQKKNYDLASIVESNLGSNRAKRANIVSEKVETPDKWIIDGDTFLGTCSNCFGDLPMAIVLEEVSEEQVTFNTGDLSLNDPLSMGDFNMKIFPTGTELCLYCMDYFFQQSVPHPSTQKLIEHYMVMADMSHQTNRRLMGHVLSKVLFGGAQLPIGFQLFLAVLDSIRIREKSSEVPNPKYSDRIIRWWINSILNKTQGNFFFHHSDGGKSENLIDAMSTLVNHHIDRHDFESWAIQLRNRVVSSMGLCSRMLLEFRSESFIPPDKYVGVMLRIVIRHIVNRFLSVTKKDEDMLDKIKNTILSEFYDTRTTSVPLKGSGHLVSIVDSPTLKLLFGNSHDRLLREITAFTNSVGITIDQFMSKQIYSTILYRLHKESPKNLKVTAEVFLKQLVQDTSDTFSMYFGSSFFNDTKDIDVLPYINNIYSNVATIDELHKGIPAFGPHLCGSYVTVCACCGTSFLSLEDLKLIKNWDARIPSVIFDIIKQKRTEHFVPVYKNNKGVTPTQSSANFSLHKAVLTVFHSNPSFVTEKFPTREMIEHVLVFLKKKNMGNIYESNLILEIISVLWDLLQQLQKGTKLPDPESIVSLTTRLKPELLIIRDTNKLFGIHIATLDGLSDDLIKQLTSPFDITVKLKDTNVWEEDE